MESALPILERLTLIIIAAFALYQSFQIEDVGRLARPAAGWAVRASLIGLAAVCLFIVARTAGMG
ncbi:MAG TPA: hypothetical protein VGG59_02565 [Acidobacteriaceae bacterium]|jgi:hypothetical protein